MAQPDPSQPVIRVCFFCCIYLLYTLRWIYLLTTYWSTCISLGNSTENRTKESDTCFCVSFQLIVGSEDFDIRVFREDEIIAEMTETEVMIMHPYIYMASNNGLYINDLCSF